MTRAEALQVAKPILFNTAMVQAIQNGTKTVTRRVVKSNPEECTSKAVNGVCKICDDKGGFYLPNDYVKARSPYQVGDLLYVRETWCKGSLNYGKEQYYYRADNKIPYCEWHPSIHMPKEAARIFLRVTGIRVERLRDITEEQAMCEGVYKKPHSISSIFPNGDYKCECKPGQIFSSARICFGCGIWDSTLKKSDIDKYGWNANPWVWVIEFEKMKVTE